MPSKVMAEIGKWISTGIKPKDRQVIVERLERLEKDPSSSIAWKDVKRS